MKATTSRRRGRPPERGTPRQARPAASEAPIPGAPLRAHLAQARATEPLRSDVPPRQAFLRSFVYAWRGLVHALRTQRNARVHAVLAVCAIALGLALRISPVEFAMVFVAITGVFIAEMFNTVAEACVDLATQEYHPLARVAKDVAAGAVLLNALLSVVIGLLVFGPHLWALFLHWRGH